MLNSKLSTVSRSSPIVMVKVAATTWSAINDEFSLSQDRVNTDAAMVGFQSAVSRLRVSVALPVFFT